MDGDAPEYVFECPECGVSLEVNGPMRDALTEKGWVVCGAPLTPAAFSEVTSTDSR